MIIEGVKLTLLGMVVVFSFLILLILVIRLSAKLLKEYTAKEAAEVAAPRRRKSVSSVEENRKLVGIISAALAAHRARCRTHPTM
ncbi:OadG family protein [Desulfobacterales bacterium HSG2]|nr:OadG family protein [Desulfobacterales bacterium HSG2]